MIRFGLCCKFIDQPIHFKTTTATAVLKMDRIDGLKKINDLCMHNANALLDALKYCCANNIRNFRIGSDILPLKTHPKLGYELLDLPDGQKIIDLFKMAGNYAKDNDIRTCFHPDQFVVLNSPKPEVVKQSLAEIEYQAELAEMVNADVINIHGGGAYQDKRKALDDFEKTVGSLSERARGRLTVENDDKTYTPADLLPVCERLGIPLLYDVHHHRCNKDALTIEEATSAAIATWNGREPMFHISSPMEGWSGKNPKSHHDYIDVGDFPDCWRKMNITVEVEAKAKELAVFQLMQQLGAL